MYLAEYLGAVVVMSALLGMISYVSYPSGSERAVKFASSVLLLFTALTPILGFAADIQDLADKDITIDLGDVSNGADKEYAKVAEEAFKDGISKLLFTKYGIEEGEADVYIYGFDFEKMKAERIKILLTEKSVFSDYRGIEEYLTESGLGECEVNVRIG